MPKYRKKPVVVEAFQMTRENREDKSLWPEWLNDAWGMIVSLTNNPPHLTIATLEGNMEVDLNDWIIKDIENELHPCKPQIFEKTYEKVESEDQPGS